VIARWIDLCARNRFLVFTGTLFLVLAGIWAERRMPLDALPDISDVQVIIHTAWNEPPNVIEDQVTYPIVTALLAAPMVKAVRAQTMFGDSYVFVVFEDGTDLYWARSRVLEYLQQIAGRLPAGVHPVIGPDATGAGWVYGIRSRRFRGLRKSRVSAVLSGSTRSDWIPTSSAPLTSRSRR
jgi:copper/silver efflux system protein